MAGCIAVTATVFVLENTCPFTVWPRILSGNSTTTLGDSRVPSLQELPYSSPLLRDGQAGSELAPAAATIPPVAAAASPETATAF
ncbi:hypothetical protein Bca52824_084405 [Brassica carinata]|uniref:Uncharacterized protein n=1 Tax=Brassica carinata TaxID=52824 RepID=A0A8X7PKV1_BRACI|nr:hypothetical protein Bca52824_084405 [Brassica carinata]